jgi:hypothetical protein
MRGAYDVVDRNDEVDQAAPDALEFHSTPRETPHRPAAAGPTAPRGAARLANPNRLTTR